MKFLFNVTIAVLILICSVSSVKAMELEEKSFDEKLEERIEKLVQSSMEKALEYTEDLQKKIIEQQEKMNRDKEPALFDLSDLQPSLPGHFNTYPSRVLVIPEEEVNVEQMVRLTEDMTVMSRILDKKLQPKSRRGIGYGGYGGYLGGHFFGDAGTKGIYLENYGAVFFAKVDFPLLAPVDSNELAKVDDTEDRLWRETKMELYDSERFRRYVEMKDKKHKSGPEYDTEKVERLKKELVKALKHAANIRDLNANSQRVIITVIGGGTISDMSICKIDGGGQVVVHDKRLKISRVNASSLPTDVALGTRSVLTVWAWKPDIDLFAKGEVDFEEFRSKARILMY